MATFFTNPETDFSKKIFSTHPSAQGGEILRQAHISTSTFFCDGEIKWRMKTIFIVS